MSGRDIADYGVDSNNDVGEEVNVNIRCTKGTFSVRVNLNSTVEEFKSIVAQKCEIPAQQQRLVYKSRIMKKSDTLKSFGLEDNHTVHLALGFSNANSTSTNAGLFGGLTEMKQIYEEGMSNSEASATPKTNPLRNPWASVGKVDMQQTRFLDSEEFRSGSSLLSISKTSSDCGLPSYLLRELSILKKLAHVNIIRLLDVKVEPPEATLIFECEDGLGIDKMIILGIDKELIKELIFQIIWSVGYCHSEKVMIRDLKPRSMFCMFSKKKVKLTDFGSAITFDDDHVYKYSTEVGTLPYKAPELLLNLNNPYTSAVDIWSVGCIFAEMVLGRPLFSKTSDAIYLSDIIRLLGVPDEIDWPGVKSACLKVCGIETLPSDPLPELASVVPDLEPAGLDLLSKMLCMVPGRRITADDALRHPYIKIN